MAKTTAIPGGRPHPPIAMKYIDGEFVCTECGATAKSGFFGELEEDVTCTGTETVLGDTGH
jgi:hypothetical protein